MPEDPDQTASDVEKDEDGDADEPGEGGGADTAGADDAGTDDAAGDQPATAADRPKEPARVGAAAGPPKAKRKRASAPQVMPPEREIGAPNRQTLGLIAAMALATLGMWGSARFACNAHPAQTRKPRGLSTAELSKDPKSSALEMQQRWSGYDFQGALELAKGSVAEEIQKAKADCERDKAGCDQKRASVDGKVLATAVVLSRDASSAKVRVTSLGGAAGDQVSVFTVEPEGPTWRVTGRTTAPTAPTPSAVAPTPTPSPSGSAAH